jgi:tetratricopeptide (TPR) repeat protein
MLLVDDIIVSGRSEGFVMKRDSKQTWTVWMAAALAPFWAAAAFGQIQVGTDGHAADANPQVGSGGYNTSVTGLTHVVTPEQIQTGNVTGGAAFQYHGAATPFTDISQFHGALPSDPMNAFLRDSAGVPTMAHPVVTPLQEGPRPWYPIANTPAPPPGFAPNPSVTAFTPARTSLQPAYDTRLGDNPDIIGGQLPMPGELLIPSQVDPTADTSAPTYYSASPLYGVRNWSADGTPFNSGSAQGSALGLSGTAGASGTQQLLMNPNYIAQMRQDLISSAGPTPSDNITQNNPNTPGNPSNLNQPTSNGPLPTLMAGGVTSSAGGQLAPLQPGSSQLAPTNLTAVAGDVSRLPPPTQQSSQYAELRRRLDQYNKTHPQQDETAGGVTAAVPGQSTSSLTNPDQSNPGSGSTGLVPGEVAAPSSPGAAGQPSAPAAAAGPSEPPLQISSLATGVKSKEMADLLKQAEDMVQHGQYSKAIESYDQAEAVAPNNAMIPLGRAHAELGGAFYRQADDDLRAAFKQDPSVLMAQYDLTTLYGDKRLSAMVADLKQIASDSPDNPTPVFLLAYIAYNTHHEDLAGGWLDVAEKRSGGNDDLIPTIKKYWSLTPATRPS